MTLSYSGLKIYEECPFRFRKRYLEPSLLIPKEFKGTAEGSLFHEFMEHVFETAKAENKPAAEAAKQLLKGSYMHRLEELPRVENLINSITFWELLDHAIEHDGKAEYKIAVDDKGRPTGFDSTDAALRGIIDLLWIEDGEIYIADYKTSERSTPDCDQLSFYASLLSSLYPNARYYGFFIRITNNGIEQLPCDIEVDLNKWLGVYERIKRATEFSPRPGLWCAWCDAAHLCPLADELPTANPEELAKRYLVLKSAVDNLRILLTEYIKAHGPIPVSDKQVLTLAQSERRYVFQNKAKRKILEEGVTAAELLEHIKISPTLLDALGITDDEVVYTKTYDSLKVIKKEVEE